MSSVLARAELVGQQVQIGERALGEGLAIEDA